jgi:hypothetical protein
MPIDWVCHHGNSIRITGIGIVTPEHKTKRVISKLLSKHKVYSYMPVPYGYGPTTLDYLGCIRGKFFAIEAKAPGKKPTPLQVNTIERIRAAGGVAFVIDGVDCDDYAALEHFLGGL